MRNSAPKYGWLVLGITILAYTIVIFHRMSPAVMAGSIMADLGVNATFMGLLASAYFYPYAVLQIPSGIVSDTASPRKLMSIALAVTSVGTLIFALAESGTMAFLGRLAVGIGCSLILMPAYKALANWFSPKMYMVIVSTVLACAVGIASALAGAPLSYFVEHFGWRMSTQGLCLITLAVTVLAWFFFKDGPQGMEMEHKERATAVSIVESIKIVLRKRNFWLLTLAFTVNAAILFSFVGLWAGLYYTHVVGLSRAQMSSLLSVAASITIITPIIFAAIAAKIPSRKNVTIAANGALFACILYLFLRNGNFNTVELYIWGIIISIVVTAPAGLYMAATRELFPKNIASTANGLIYSFSMFGAAIFQPIIGLLLDNAGYTDTLTASMFNPICWLYLIACTIAFGAMFVMKEKDKVLV